MTDQERIEQLENEKEILLKGYEIIFQTRDYSQLLAMRQAMTEIGKIYPSEAEPKRIVQVLDLVKGFFRES
jgi:hypothetical protein